MKLRNVNLILLVSVLVSEPVFADVALKCVCMCRDELTGLNLSQSPANGLRGEMDFSENYSVSTCHDQINRCSGYALRSSDMVRSLTSLRDGKLHCAVIKDRRKPASVPAKFR